MTGTRVRILVAVVAALAGLGVIAPAAANASPYCGLTWGSQAKSVHATEPGDDLVTGVRAGRHACYDRVVVDVADVSGFDAWSVRYVPAVRSPGSGDVVPLRGGAALQVTLGAVAYDESGDPTYSPANPREVVDVRGFPTLRQVRWLGSYEGRTDLGIGTRARLPFRVFLIEGSSAGLDRLVIDVAHRWEQ
ncbi:AMIN-like domain-containing (lipo)protein [Geodermatophilus sp. CPCC 206100]|uniref:AMIN-like domain-containing (lipo)protein n=1 Tax=Geodermatophilus sp. CPCC 206100 TaxID=3020054 RepID=UPI003B00D3CF